MLNQVLQKDWIRCCQHSENLKVGISLNIHFFFTFKQNSNNKLTKQNINVKVDNNSHSYLCKSTNS